MMRVGRARRGRRVGIAATSDTRPGEAPPSVQTGPPAIQSVADHRPRWALVAGRVAGINGTRAGSAPPPVDVHVFYAPWRA